MHERDSKRKIYVMFSASAGGSAPGPRRGTEVLQTSLNFAPNL